MEDDAYFSNLIHYIHANPVHHGFVKHLTDWPHSSYHALLSDRDTKLKRQDVLDWFYGKRKIVKYHGASPLYDRMSFEL